MSKLLTATLILLTCVTLTAAQQTLVGGQGKIGGQGIASRGAGGGGCSPSDTFTGSDHASLSANWTTSTGGWEILSNSAHATSASAYSVAYWNQCSLGADQTSSTVIGALVADTYVGPAVRFQTGSVSGYICIADVNGSAIKRMDSGSATNLATALGSAAGRTLSLTITGTSLSCTDGTITLTATDATYATGKVGIAGFSNDPGSLIDSWSAH